MCQVRPRAVYRSNFNATTQPTKATKVNAISAVSFHDSTPPDHETTAYNEVKRFDPYGTRPSLTRPSLSASEGRPRGPSRALRLRQWVISARAAARIAIVQPATLPYNHHTSSIERQANVWQAVSQ